MAQVVHVVRTVIRSRLSAEEVETLVQKLDSVSPAFAKFLCSPTPSIPSNESVQTAMMAGVEYWKAAGYELVRSCTMLGRASLHVFAAALPTWFTSRNSSDRELEEMLTFIARKLYTQLVVADGDGDGLRRQPGGTSYSTQGQLQSPAEMLSADIMAAVTGWQLCLIVRYLQNEVDHCSSRDSSVPDVEDSMSYLGSTNLLGLSPSDIEDLMEASEGSTDEQREIVVAMHCMLDLLPVTEEGMKKALPVVPYDPPVTELPIMFYGLRPVRGKVYQSARRRVVLRSAVAAALNTIQSDATDVTTLMEQHALLTAPWIVALCLIVAWGDKYNAAPTAYVAAFRRYLGRCTVQSLLLADDVLDNFFLAQLRSIRPLTLCDREVAVIPNEAAYHKALEAVFAAVRYSSCLDYMHAYSVDSETSRVDTTVVKTVKIPLNLRLPMPLPYGCWVQSEVQVPTFKPYAVIAVTGAQSGNLALVKLFREIAAVPVDSALTSLAWKGLKRSLDLLVVKADAELTGKAVWIPGLKPYGALLTDKTVKGQLTSVNAAVWVFNTSPQLTKTMHYLSNTDCSAMSWGEVADKLQWNREGGGLSTIIQLGGTIHEDGSGTRHLVSLHGRLVKYLLEHGLDPSRTIFDVDRWGSSKDAAFTVESFPLAWMDKCTRVCCAVVAPLRDPRGQFVDCVAPSQLLGDKAKVKSLIGEETVQAVLSLLDHPTVLSQSLSFARYTKDGGSPDGSGELYRGDVMCLFAHWWRCLTLRNDASHFMPAFFLDRMMLALLSSRRLGIVPSWSALRWGFEVYEHLTELLNHWLEEPSMIVMDKTSTAPMHPGYGEAVQYLNLILDHWQDYPGRAHESPTSRADEETVMRILERHVPHVTAATDVDDKGLSSLRNRMRQLPLRATSHKRSAYSEVDEILEEDALDYMGPSGDFSLSKDKASGWVLPEDKDAHMQAFSLRQWFTSGGGAGGGAGGGRKEG